MTTPMLMTEHPTEELLAEYIDDRLESATREPVTDHLATCGECREIVLMTADFQAIEPANVTRGNFGARRWMVPAGLAAAAVIAFMLVGPPLFGPGVDELVAASEGTPKRISDGRFAGGRGYNDPPERKRGEVETDFDATKVKLYELELDAREAIWSNPHTLGLARLLNAENPDDIRNAVAILETAYREASGEKRDAIAIDLAAALAVRAGYAKRPGDDYEYSLKLSNDVLQRSPNSPEALWNRAVALESLNRDNDALRAYDDYLKVDPSSKWADEARDRKATIESYR